MTITDFGGVIYYINNPIIVRLEGIAADALYIDIDMVNQTASPNVISNTLRLYPNGTELTIDLSEYVKGNFTEPNLPEIESIVNGDPINTNYIEFRLSFREQRPSTSSTLISTKTYFRGGTDTLDTNVTASVGDILKESDRIPQWGGFPIKKYYVESDRTIRQSILQSSDDVEQMKIYGCNPLYVRFLNSKGGYSFWLFESWEQRKRIKSLDVIERNYSKKDLHLGTTKTTAISAETRVKRPYYNTIEALLSSPEVYFYNMFNQTWAPVRMGDNPFDLNNYTDIQKVKLNFDVRLLNNSALIW